MCFSVYSCVFGWIMCKLIEYIPGVCYIICFYFHLNRHGSNELHVNDWVSPHYTTMPKVICHTLLNLCIKFVSNTGGYSIPEVAWWTSDHWFEPTLGHVSSIISPIAHCNCLAQFNLSNVHKESLIQHVSLISQRWCLCVSKSLYRTITSLNMGPLMQDYMIISALSWIITGICQSHQNCE